MKADLRVKLGQFMAELQRSAGLTTGRIDARFTGYTYDLLRRVRAGRSRRAGRRRRVSPRSSMSTTTTS